MKFDKEQLEENIAEVIKPCPFCKENWDNLDIVKRIYPTTPEPFTKILIINPLNPVTSGHVLVISEKHTNNAASSPVVAAELMREAAAYVQQMEIQANIITSIGPDATQTVRHTHVHIVPRTQNDGLTLPWTGQDEV